MKYMTVAEEASFTYIEKKSEFIARISPVKTIEEAESFINLIRGQNRKARHNVYAYILREGNSSRYSDDGEPQGTAGIPVLEVLKKAGLTDVCVVVTRYFGGVLLGANGLVRAYSAACTGAADAAKKKYMEDAVEFCVKCSYSLYGKITFALARFEVKTLNSDFGSDVSLKLLVRAEAADDLKTILTDMTCGNAEMDISDIFEADFA